MPEITETIQDALRRAASARSSRWAKGRKAGLSDRGIEVVLSEVIGRGYSGTGGPGQYWVKMQNNAAGVVIWIAEGLPETTGVCYSGKKLVDAVRLALDLPYAGGVKQPSLFNLDAMQDSHA